ncbi:MAG TPA: hypothetical protein DC049_15355, partial [Spirochaetia bacterium]|nr:hypothetical protein [Spirochaetia bacterium]
MTEGKIIGKYKIKEKIAQGGMGAVYKALHPTLGREVILKQLTLRGSVSFQERFRREARIMMDFRDDRIVQVYDHFKEGSSYFMVMEYIDGMTLEQLIRQKGYIENVPALLIISEVAKALQYAHERGIVHRDIKPANIMISKNGEVKLTDFGIARDIEDEDNLTHEGMTLGTPAYMSPEQIASSKSVDYRSDIYSLGVMLYEMTSGSRPFPGNFSAEALVLIQKGRYTAPEKINPGISRPVRAIIKKAMQRRPGRRFFSCTIMAKKCRAGIPKFKNSRALQNAIKNYLDGKPVSELADKPWSRLIKNITLLIACISVCAGAFIWMYLSGFYHDFFLAHKYGSLRIRVLYHSTAKAPEEIFISANLYDQYRPVRVSNFNPVFRINKSLSGTESIMLESPKIRLPCSNYAVNIFIENEKYHEKFFLLPASAQKETPGQKDGKLILLEYKGSPPLPLDLSINARHRETGEILPRSGIQIRYVDRQSLKPSGSWIGLDQALSDKNIRSFLITGETYGFRFVYDGFYEQEVWLKTDRHQTVLKLEAECAPLPGTLLYQSAPENCRIKINNAAGYISGGRKREYLKIPPAEKKGVKILLPPGTYNLSAASGWTENYIEIKISQGKTCRLIINTEKEISFRVQQDSSYPEGHPK